MSEQNDAQKILEQSTYSQLRKIVATKSEGNIVLEGDVNSFWEKQLAQELVKTVGVNVKNNLVVKK